MNGRASRGAVVVSDREAQIFDLVGEQLTQVQIGERRLLGYTFGTELTVATLLRRFASW